MGKTSKPLRIAVIASLRDTPEIQALADKGHTIIPFTLEGCDLVLAPNAWRMDKELLPYVDMAVKGARAIKYVKDQGNEG